MYSITIIKCIHPSYQDPSLTHVMIAHDITMLMMDGIFGHTTFSLVSATNAKCSLNGLVSNEG